MAPIGNNIIVYVSTMLASLSYSYYVSSKIPKGIYRFISLIPVIYLFTILPLSCSFTFSTAVTFSFTTWLTNFKLIRFAFDLDQSPFHPSYSLSQFIAFTSLPIKPKTLYPASQKSSPKKILNKLGVQITVLIVLVKTIIIYSSLMHRYIIAYIYGWLLYLLIDIVNAIVNTLLILFTELELEPSSNEPYRATSLQNFWARWNLLVTNTLRHTIYKPIVSACSNRKWAPLVGILGSFLVSGLMHELLVYELSCAMPTWELTSFFVIHGICVVAEMVVKRMLRWRLPDFVAIFLVNAFITVTGVWLFIPPFISARVDVKYLEEYTLVAESIKTKFIQSYMYDDH